MTDDDADKPNGSAGFTPSLEIHDDYVVLGTTRLERKNVGWKEGAADWRMMWGFIYKRLKAMGDYRALAKRKRENDRAYFKRMAGLVDD